MKILYVTPLVAGFEDILKGEKDSRGLPSFILPLKYLLEEGNTVNIILISNYTGGVNIKTEWISNENIVANVNNDFASTHGFTRVRLKIKSLLEVRRIISKSLKTGEYDFVYCHGTAAYIGNILANKYSVRCGYRIYGVVDIAHDIKRFGLTKAIIKYPIYFRIFRKKKNFLLITDDGTDGDYVFKKFNPRRTVPLYYWTNGVDKGFRYERQARILQGCGCYEQNYIFHAARITRLKRQDRIIEVLNELHKRENKIHLIFAGHITDDSYYKELMEATYRYGLTYYVHFCGAIERGKMQSLAHDAIATVLLADFSNQGNVFFECAIAGSVIITHPEESLKKYIDDKKSGFFVDNEKQAAKVVEDLIAGVYDRENIRISIRNIVDEKLLSWDERVHREIDLIKG